ncbi:MAG TPA: acetylglutamate kinase, partial [Bryobacteraceae bacterium]|nr:acetylglutamate kinase [Bryobacteraceae bacterium]
VIDAASKVIAGSVNKQLVAALHKAGQRAVGLSGIDGHLTIAEQWHADLGYVGRPVQSNGPLLNLLAGAAYLPVVACLAADAKGVVYNVNADQMAVSIALAFRAEKLFFLTDVPGVRATSGSVVRQMNPLEAAALIQSGTAYGGMQAKLEAACAALAGGVAEVVIAPGGEARVCARILAGETLGTRLVPAAVPPTQGSRA